MEVVFERTGERRYSVTAASGDYPAVTMDPAPGYDELLPHDLMHFVVEDELGLQLGIFGQLSNGGSAGTFRLAEPVGTTRERARARRAYKRRGERQSREGAKDAALSEASAAVCHRLWPAAASSSSRSAAVARLARELAAIHGRPVAVTTAAEILRRLDELSTRWRGLPVGDRITLTWPTIAKSLLQRRTTE